MWERRLPLAEVDRLMAEGKSMAETARLLGFSKQAVSAALKKRKQGSEKIPVKTGPEAVSDFEGLKLLKRIMAPVFHEIKLLNTKIGDIEPGTDGRKDLNFERLKYIAEARKQLALALLIDEKRFDFEEVLKFQNYVLETIGEISEDAREEILSKLRGGKSIRRALDQG